MYTSIATSCAGSPPPPAVPGTPNEPAAVSGEALACDDASSVDVVHHDVTLHMSPAAAFTGEGELQARVRAATRTVVLDAHGFKVTRAALAGRAVPFQQQEKRVCLTLPQPMAAGGGVALQLAWEVTAASDSLHLATDQIWAGYDAAAWMPTRMDSAQRATLRLRIDAPRGWAVIASGKLREQQDRADATSHTFEVERPVPPFLFAFAAGEFERASIDVEGVQLHALGAKGVDLASALEITAPMLRFFSQRTGRPLPAREYTQVFVAGDAAQEAAGFALIGASAIADARANPHEDWVFSHELAHQWFGWLVPCADFNDFWLNEGFATFLTAAYKQERWGEADYMREVSLWRERSQRVHDQGKDAPLSPSAPGRPALASPRDSELPARGVTYSRGALVLHRLRSELGEQAFWAGIQRYVADRAEQGARSEDLRAALEAASGKNLSAFFERWVYAAAHDL